MLKDDETKIARQLEILTGITNANAVETTRILSYLENDDKTGRVGLVQKVENHEKRAAKDAKRISDLENINEKKDFANKKLSVVYGSIGATVIFCLEEALHWLKIIK